MLFSPKTRRPLQIRLWVKKPGSFFWSGRKTPAKVEQLMGEGKIDESWRISPYRQQERAVSVKEYVQSPSILERWTTKEEERIKRSTPLLAKLLLIVALVCLIPFIVVGLWIALYLAAK